MDFYCQGHTSLAVQVLLPLMRITWLNWCALRNVGHPWIPNAHCWEQFFPLQSRGHWAHSNSELCPTAWRVTAMYLLLLWSSPCPTCAAALTFRNFSPSPLLSKSTGQGVSSVVAALCSAGNKTGSLTQGCIGCNTQQSIVGETQRVPNVTVLTPQWYFDGAGKRGRAQAWVQLYPHPAASASSASSARVTHQEATCDHFIPAQRPACVTLPSALPTVETHGKKQRQALYLPGPGQHSAACRDAPGTLPSSPRSRTRTSSEPGPHGQGRVSTVLPTYRVPSPRERLFQPILSNLGLPKSGRRSPFCVVQCSAKVLHLN